MIANRFRSHHTPAIYRYLGEYPSRRKPSDDTRPFDRDAGQVPTHRQLLKDVWGPQQTQEAHYLRVFMANLRRKLEPDPARPQFLLTEQGVGYRLACD